MNAPQQTLCAEPVGDTHHPCGWAAVGPHPVDGYARPVCARHMRQARVPFDPEDQATWPLPRALEPRRSIVARAWLDGFGIALEGADTFYRTNEWPEDWT